VTTVQTLSLLLVAAYFAFLLGSLVLRGREISGPWLFLLRSFFPNWRFYHGFGHQPRLFMRTLGDNRQWSDWQMFIPRAPFVLAHLLHNPRNNLLLANQNLVDHLAFDIQALPDGHDARKLVSYQMVTRAAREHLRAQGHEGRRWQVQIRQVPPLQVPVEDMAILISPELEG
jgi:hypothetical protein